MNNQIFGIGPQNETWGWKKIEQKDLRVNFIKTTEPFRIYLVSAWFINLGIMCKRYAKSPSLMQQLSKLTVNTKSLFWVSLSLSETENFIANLINSSHKMS